MISLIIQNLILIERCEIHFDPGLNIITGETGAGKSAILTALRLINGARADLNWIRKGAEFAVVEVRLESGSFIRREISKQGKNRCFIDDMQVSLAEMKAFLQIDLIDQNQSYTFLQRQVELFDRFAKTDQITHQLKELIQRQKQLKEKLEHLLQIPKTREIEWIESSLSELQELKKGLEKEELFHLEHDQLTKHEKMGRSLQEAFATLNAAIEEIPLKRAHILLEPLIKLDPLLKPIDNMVKNGLLELEEAKSSLEQYIETIECDPKRLQFVEKSLLDIFTLKKKFGTDLSGQETKFNEQLEMLYNLDDTIEKLEKEVSENENTIQKLYQSLKEQREQKAPLFSQLIEKELKELNLIDAKFQVDIQEGLNDVVFLFSANRGHPLIPVEKSASGGELSRLMFAIKMVMVDETSVLIFDEIDSNVGGHSALVLGQKLQKIAENRQVISITHFVQVARYADAHFYVFKEIKGDFTYTRVQKIDEKEKKIEYNRMLGQSC